MLDSLHSSTLLQPADRRPPPNLYAIPKAYKISRIVVD